VLSRIPWRRRLSVRLTLAVSAATLASIGPFVVLGLRAQECHVEAVAVRVAALLSDSIKSSTHDNMLADRRQDAYATMEAIGRGEGIEKVRIFNKEGRVMFSTHAAEIGAAVDKRAESCYACHAAGRALERLSLPSRSRIYHEADGHRILAMVTPIYNDPSCSQAACHAHPAAQRVLGVVDVGISLRDVDAQSALLRRSTLAGAGLGMLVVAAGVSFFASRLLVRPVGDVVLGTERIAAGELDHRIPVRDDGEVGALARSFNGMTDSLAAARAEIRGLLEELERKVEQRTAALREAQAQLVQAAKMASLGRMAASIAHEINNPLAGILTFSRLMIRDLDEDRSDAGAREAMLKNLRLVERETQRCTSIVRNLLDFARQRPLTLSDVDLNAVIDEALSLVGNQIALKGVVLEKRLGEIPTVKADLGQLRQACVNVILNGCDAMKPGGVLTVTTEPCPDAKGVVARFDDTGSGIPPEIRAHIFDPFFSTKEKGTGLGLSVVYGIVERHGGRLEVDSTPGKGTSLRLLLPLEGALPA
jgi:two-component system NtrC family sensor kinase